MENYHLLYDANVWKLKAEGGARFVAEYPGKTEAVEGAPEIVRQCGGSLKVHNTAATIGEERIRPRSADPQGFPDLRAC